MQYSFIHVLERLTSNSLVDDNTNFKGGVFRILLSNLQSGSNIGAICRNAFAFNATEVILVGRKGIPQMRQSDRGARQRLKFTHFSIWNDAVAYLKNDNEFMVVLEVNQATGSIYLLKADRSTGSTHH